MLANTKKQKLEYHLAGVAKRAVDIFDTYLDFGAKTDSYRKILINSALKHDIGKVSPEFQDFIKTTKEYDPNRQDGESKRPKRSKKTWTGVYHHELSWAISPFNEFEDYIVYWHHASSRDAVNDDRNKASIRNKFDKSLIKEIKDEADKVLISATEIFNKSAGMNIGVPKTSINASRQVPSFASRETSDWDEYADKMLLLLILIQSDREVSSLNPDQLNNYLDNKECSVIHDLHPLYRNEQKSGGSITTQNQRSEYQQALAEKMAKYQHSVCGVDAGGGKTEVALRWWGGNGKLTILLPKIDYVKSMFFNLSDKSSDLTRVFSDSEQITLQSIFSNKVQETTGPAKPFEAQITITIMDYVFKSIYNRQLNYELWNALTNDLVLDEFHDLYELPRMVYAISVLLMMRNRLKNKPKTLFLSGTPNPALIKVIESKASIKTEFFSRKELPAHDDKKIKFTIKDWDEKTIKNNCIVQDSLTKNVNRMFRQSGKGGLLVHSDFIPDHKKQRLERLLGEFGKGSTSEENIYSPILLSSSFNISRKNLFLTSGMPDVSVQYFGRCNRFSEHQEALVIIRQPVDASRLKRFPDIVEISRKFFDHVKNVIGDGRLMARREANELIYDKFFENKENMELMVAKLTDNMTPDSLNLGFFYPKKYCEPDPSKKPKEFGPGFRGDGSSSVDIHWAAVDENGNTIKDLSKEKIVVSIEKGRREEKLVYTDDYGAIEENEFIDKTGD